MFHRFYLLLHSLPIVQFPTRMGGWAKWQILRVKKEGGNPHLVCNSLKFKLITGKVFQWTFLEPAKWWFFTRVFIRAGPIPKNVEILIDWELIQKIFSILKNLFFFMIQWPTIAKKHRFSIPRSQNWPSPNFYHLYVFEAQARKLVKIDHLSVRLSFPQLSIWIGTATDRWMANVRATNRCNRGQYIF